MYIFWKEVEVVEIIQVIIIRQNQVLWFRVCKECWDWDGKERVIGEEWLVIIVGVYFLVVFEEVLDLVDVVIFMEKIVLYFWVWWNFWDFRGVFCCIGEEWLVIVQDIEVYVLDVYEEVLGVVFIIILGFYNYCVIFDFVGLDGKNQLGQKCVVKGEKFFFFQLGEQLE